MLPLLDYDLIRANPKVIVVPLGIPAYRGAMIGYIKRQFTLPLGIETEMDADRGSLKLLEPAVL